jgi:hypothetical protein
MAERVIHDVVTLNPLPAAAGNTLAGVPAVVGVCGSPRCLTSDTACIDLRCRLYSGCDRPSTERFQHGCRARACNLPAVIDVLGQRRVSVAKLIGRRARRQSRLIHEGRRRLAEGMARYPRIARASECFPKIRLRIARVSPATEDRRKDGIGSRPCQQHLDAPRRESQRSLTSSGFSRLAGQTSTIKPDHGSVHGDSSVLKINVFPQKPSRFADRATGAKHEGNKIGEVPAYRFVVIGEQGSKLLRLCHGQGTGRLGSSSADGPDVTDGIYWPETPVSGGCSGCSTSILPWSSRNGG